MKDKNMDCSQKKNISSGENVNPKEESCGCDSMKSDKRNPSQLSSDDNEDEDSGALYGSNKNRESKRTEARQ